MSALTKHNYILIAVAMMFAMRALLPLGVMPSFAGGTGFSLEICMGSEQQLSPQAQKIEQELASLLEQEVPKHPAEEMSDDLCSFASHVSKHALIDNTVDYEKAQFLESPYKTKKTEQLALRNVSFGFSVRAPPLTV